jgi:hypothetical protein
VISNEDIAALKESSAKAAESGIEEAGTIKEEEHEQDPDHHEDFSSASAADVERLGHLTPPVVFPQVPGHKSTNVIQTHSDGERGKLGTPPRGELDGDMDATPRPATLTPTSGGSSNELDPDPTPRGASSPSRKG